MKILIVEDDFITSQVLQEITSAFGKTDAAEDGFRAFDLFTASLAQNEPYDVIFLDIMMPDMDGQEVLERVREIEAINGIQGLDGVKIIMTTALDDFSNIKKAFNNQCEGYIVKPFDKDKIAKALINAGIL
jgi:two-component system, chemotaxis family, chemotaxis protein CheY